MGDESKRTRDETWPFALKQEGRTFVQGGHRSFTTSPTGYAPGHAKATFRLSRGNFYRSQARGFSRPIREADQGTLFLDEIGDMPIQARLLRFLDEKTVRSHGSYIEEKVDVMILAATNCAIEEAEGKGWFSARI